MIHLARETQKLHNLGLFVIIDSKVQDYSMLVEGVERDATILILDPLRDGLEQITQLIQRFKFQIKNIQIICHGAPGLLYLGNTILSLENIEEYSSHLQQWNVDEILLYSCNVAAPIPHKKIDHLFPVSHRFLNRLHQLTTANIAASSTPIGNSKKGGNWELDIQIGKITSPVIFKPEILAAYPSVLAITFTNILAGLTGVQRSSLAWGDYDNDNDLDILLTGFDGNNRISQVYRNDVGTFNNINAELMGVSSSSVAWGDYDNDGDLDIVLSGDDNNLNPVSKIYRNDGGNFIDINAAITNIRASSVAWGDYDNDGDLDIVLSGSDGSQPITQVYRNQNGTFVESGAELVGVSTGSVDWGDYDNDGDLDILLTGLGQSLLPFSRVYRNDNGNFTNINAGLRDVWFGSGVWGDYDNDGQLDIFLTGRDNGGTPVTKIYRNEGSSFTDINENVTNGEGSSGVWGDYDNDGDLDILLASDSGSFNPISRIYRNDAGNFVEINPGVTDVRDSSVAWGDYDNDGDLDILVAGIDGSSNRVTQVYQNDGTPPNTPPSLVPKLNATVFENSVDFSWESASDAETPAASLTYNLRVGTTPGGLQVFTPQSQTPTSGNVGSNTRWMLGNLEPGTYYWSVQAVDSAFAESPFAPEGTFEILPTTFYNFSVPNFTTLEGNTANVSNLVEIIRTGDVNTTEEVTVTVVGGTADTTDYTNTPFSVNFNPGETSKFVAIELLGDLNFEPDETLELQLSSFSGVGGAGLQDTTTLVLENDDLPATYNFISPNLTTPEGNTPNLSNLVEIIRTGDVNTTEEVTVTVVGGTADKTDYTNTPFSVNFNPGETSKFVAIELLGDLNFEPDETLELQLSGFSGVGGAGLQDTTTLVLENDDSLPQIEFEQVNYQVNEDTPEIEVTLNRIGNTSETATVEIKLSDQTATGGVDFDNQTILVNFAPNQTTATVNIPIFEDDFIEDNERFELTLINPSETTEIGIQNVANVEIFDNDIAGFNLTPTNLFVSEFGTTDSYSLSLSTEPTSPVTVRFNTDNQLESISEIIFDSTNWNIPQILQVTASDDAIAEGLHQSAITHLVTSEDLNYHNFEIADINVEITDNDTAGILITPVNLSVSESGETNSYNIVLTTAPTHPVTVQFETGNQLNSIPEITFDQSNWNVSQTVTVSAIDDSEIEEDQTVEILHNILSQDKNYQELELSAVVATITDNDVNAEVVINSNSITTIEEGQTTSYEVVLTSPPTSPVTVDFNTSDRIQLIPAIVFDDTNWNIPQTVTIFAFDDEIKQENKTQTVTHSVESLDQNFNELVPAEVSVEITDNDSAAVAITQTFNTTEVSENGGTDTYSVVLESQPVADVSVTLTPDNQIDLNQGVGEAINLTFTPKNWNLPQILTVEAVDDEQLEAEIHSSTINHSVESEDSNYHSDSSITIDGVEATNLTVQITENDQLLPPGIPGIRLIKPIGSTNLLEGFSQDSYKIVLQSIPTAEVNITIVSDDQIQSNQQVITFTPDHWNIPQTVTLTAIEDDRIEGETTSLVTHTVSSEDSRYQSLEIDKIFVNIADYNTTEDATILSEPSVISLTDIDNKIIGSVGEDVIYGRDGNDRLSGEAGADFILGQAGSDGMSGEDGDDILVGGQGNDHIYGNLGNDIIFGDSASDRLWGGGGNDQLFGGFGDDRLFGEAGRDTLTGGLGNDAFVVGVGTGGSTIEQADILADFTDTQDRIELIDSLTFEQLNIIANSEGTAAIIQIQSSGEYLAILPGVSVESLDSQDFV